MKPNIWAKSYYTQKPPAGIERTGLQKTNKGLRFLWKIQVATI